jgi:hypothetical protein
MEGVNDDRVEELHGEAPASTFRRRYRFRKNMPSTRTAGPPIE